MKLYFSQIANELLRILKSLMKSHQKLSQYLYRIFAETNIENAACTYVFKRLYNKYQIK